MAAIGDLVATLGMNTKPFKAGAARAKDAMKRMELRVKSSVANMQASFMGLGGIIGIGAFTMGMRKALAATRVQEQAEKKLNAVLIATGGAAGFSAKQLAAYAAALQKVTNFGDEATISMMGVLATFKNIKGDMFKDAVAAVQDMASVMGTDMKASVIQVGKALNDPITGMTSLTRMGVTFTEEQRKQVKLLQKQGDLLGAQRVIMAELQSQFSGAAREMVDPLTQALNELGDIWERIGKFIKPVFVALVPVIGAVVTAFEGAQIAVLAFVGVLAKVARVMTLGLSDSVNTFEDSIQRTLENMIEDFRGVDAETRGVAKSLTGVSVAAAEATKMTAAMKAELKKTANWAVDIQHSFEKMKEDSIGIISTGIASRAANLASMLKMTAARAHEVSMDNMDAGAFTTVIDGVNTVIRPMEMLINKSREMREAFGTGALAATAMLDALGKLVTPEEKLAKYKEDLDQLVGFGIIKAVQAQELLDKAFKKSPMGKAAADAKKAFKETAADINEVAISIDKLSGKYSKLDIAVFEFRRNNKNATGEQIEQFRKLKEKLIALEEQKALDKGKKPTPSLPRALERGSKEAMNRIIRAGFGDKKNKQDKKIADNTARTAKATEQIAEKPPVEEVSIP